MVAIVCDDPTAPWETIPLQRFGEVASAIPDTTDTSIYSPVAAVLLQRVSAKGPKCLSATLRDEYVHTASGDEKAH
eukprot:3534975-Pleurochrysis_carterae.AAC.1